jgi:hypothetical protein
MGLGPTRLLAHVSEQELEALGWRVRVDPVQAVDETLSELARVFELDRRLAGERVLVLTRFTGRGRTSGVELGQMRSEGAGLFHVRDGKVTRLLLYVDLETAFADVGLPSEAGSQRS